MANGLPWSTQFLFAIWGLWKHRNRVVFENSPLNFCLHKSCIQQSMEYHFCVSKVRIPKPCSTNLVRWNKPEEGWFKLNTDGASLGNPSKAGGGGVIRNCNGNQVKGYKRRVRVATSIIAEFWALRDGLILADQLGITHLAVELDAKVIVQLVLSNNNSNRAYYPLLNDCRFLLSRFHHFKVNHVFKEANRVANKLAKEGCSSPFDFVILENPDSVELRGVNSSQRVGFVSCQGRGIRLNGSTLTRPI